MCEDLADTRSESIVHLIFVGMSANSPRFADKAIEYLVAKPDWLTVSWSNGHAWGTRRLLELMTPHTSSAALAALESALLAYYPTLERSAAGRDFYGHTQFALLGGIARERRSDAVMQRLREWQRKFECDDVPPPMGIQGGDVRSPIAQESALRMSDLNWRSAIARYTGDRERTFSGGVLVGGASQLANLLESETRNDPQRFADLAVSLPDSTDFRYFDAVLRGVADSDASVSTATIEALLQRCHQLPDRPCGRWITRPLLSAPSQPLSDSMVEIVEWYASADPTSVVADVPDVDDLDESLLYRGLNSVRGSVASVISHLIAHNRANYDILRPAALRLIADEDVGIRAVAAHIVLALLSHNSQEALEAFKRLTEDAPDALLANRYVYQFLHRRISIDLDQLRPTIERMLQCPKADVQTNGAALASLAALSDDDATEMARPCLQGSEHQRLGAARVYAANLTKSRFRQRCAEALYDLFDDESQLVRNAAAEVVREFSGADLDDFGDVLHRLVNSAAATDNWGDILATLIESTGAATSLALTVCERALSTSSISNANTVPARPDLVSRLLVRIYTDNLGEARAQRARLDRPVAATGRQGDAARPRDARSRLGKYLTNRLLHANPQRHRGNVATYAGDACSGLSLQLLVRSSCNAARRMPFRSAFQIRLGAAYPRHRTR